MHIQLDDNSPMNLLFRQLPIRKMKTPLFLHLCNPYDYPNKSITQINREFFSRINYFY